MRVLLVIPANGYGRTKAPVGITDLPIGMAYVSAHLKRQGHNVWACNLNNREEPVEDALSRSLIAFEPQAVLTGGISADYACLKEIVRVCRAEAPNARLTIGGGIATHDPEFVREHLRPDTVFEGEFDWSPGQSLDELPWPDYSIFGAFMDQARFTRWLYRFPQDKPRPMVVVAARSCPFRCSFCVHEKRVPYRARSIANVMAELREMHDRYRFNVLVILDELFAAKCDRVAEFSQAVLESRMRFSWCFQTHSSARLDVGTLRLARAAGCYLFAYGLESASPRVLASMNKRSSPERIVEGISAAREAGVLFGGNFIFGDPAETWSTVAQSLMFWWRHCRGCFITFSGVRPYPGSRLFEFCLERGLIRDKLSYYETVDRHYVNMTAMPTWLWLAFLRVMGAVTRLLVWNWSRKGTL